VLFLREFDCVPDILFVEVGMTSQEFLESLD